MALEKMLAMVEGILSVDWLSWLVMVKVGMVAGCKRALLQSCLRSGYCSYSLFALLLLSGCPKEAFPKVEGGHSYIFRNVRDDGLVPFDIEAEAFAC